MMALRDRSCRVWSSARRAAWAGSAALLVLGCVALPAGAQDGAKGKAEELRPPAPQIPREDQSILFPSIVGAVVAGGLAVGACLIPVKRGKNPNE
jgi:hypothetical protein